jgi:hypothetical protein
METHRLSGIFGNVDLMFYYLQTLEGVLQSNKTPAIPQGKLVVIFYI